MKRNLDHRVETVAPVADPALQRELDAILDLYDADNATAWDLRSDGTYVRRAPAPGEARRSAQDMFVHLAHEGRGADRDDQEADEAPST
jgi:polyphosphate kinase